MDFVHAVVSIYMVSADFGGVCRLNAFMALVASCCFLLFNVSAYYKCRSWPVTHPEHAEFI